LGVRLWPSRTANLLGVTLIVRGSLAGRSTVN
jgi:hypothetical protein